MSLILYAEHEFNASTFTARVVCSTLSDLHSAVVAAIGALKGPLHGGANEKVMDILEAAGVLHWEQTAEIIEKVLGEEKHLFPNLDWPAGRLYYALGLEIPLYTPIFVMSRVAGWSAHFIEQHEHNRLIRPRSRYVGPEVRHALPLGQRG